MAGKVVLVAGLPGCGKTTALAQMNAADLLIFDDFKAGAYNDSSAFRDSRRYSVLVSALRRGEDCVVADIDFCSPAARSEAERTLLQAVEGVEIECWFFANDPATCEANIRLRRRESMDRDIQKLRDYAAIYAVPENATVLPVGRATDTPCGRTMQLTAALAAAEARMEASPRARDSASTGAAAPGVFCGCPCDAVGVTWETGTRT